MTAHFAELLVRACWDLELRIVPVRVTTGGAPPSSPVIQKDDDPVLHLPWLADAGPENGLTLAAAMHAAAHLHFSPSRLERSGLKPLQQVIYGLLEDARVDHLAAHRFPGLWSLWLSFHRCQGPIGAEVADVNGLLRRLSRVLMDPDCEDAHPWITKGRRLFLAATGSGAALAHSSLRTIAALLGNDLGQMRLQFSPASHCPWPAYRDDNSHLWQPDDQCPEDAVTLLSGRAEEHKARLQSSLHNGATLPSPLPPLDSQPARPDKAEAGTTEHTLPQACARLAGTVPEWDYVCSSYRAQWCRIVEQVPQPADPGDLLRLLQSSSRWLARTGAALRRAGRTRRAETLASDGHDLAPDAIISSAIALRARRTPDARVFLAPGTHSRTVHVCFILDTSVSTATPVAWGAPSSQVPLLDAMKAAVAVGAATLEHAGHRCSIVGFSSNTRQFVRLQPVKSDRESIYSEEVAARLSGLQPEWSTRTGAALRHVALAAKTTLSSALLVLVTDGEPHDIDMADPVYLMEDLRRAAAEAGRQRLSVLCIGLGPVRTEQSSMPEALRPVHVQSNDQLALVLMQALADLT